jgi:signal transduction histidine kinase
VEIAAYFVAAESVTNAVRHAEATMVEVDIAELDDGVRVRVRDDGIGGADPSRGSGLVGLRDRVEALGGALTVESSPQSGTLIEATIPMSPTPQVVSVD